MWKNLGCIGAIHSQSEYKGKAALLHFQQEVDGGRVAEARADGMVGGIDALAFGRALRRGLLPD